MYRHNSIVKNIQDNCTVCTCNDVENIIKAKKVRIGRLNMEKALALLEPLIMNVLTIDSIFNGLGQFTLCYNSLIHTFEGTYFLGHTVFTADR